MFNKLMVLGAASLACTGAMGQASLENPLPAGTESGIGIISGYHCTSRNITFRVDGYDLGKAGAGTERGDTKALCGRSDTGFSLLFNFNLLTPGSHNLSMYADGQLVESRNFFTTRSAGSEFVAGKTRSLLMQDFPQKGQSTRLDWVTAKQSFVITDSGVNAAANYACDMTSQLHGVWSVSTVSSSSRETFTVNKNNLYRGNDNASPVPCVIVTKESSSLYTYSVAYGIVEGFQRYVFMKQGMVTGEMFFLESVADKPDQLTGYKQSYWASDMSLFGATTDVTATRTSRTVLSAAGSPPPTDALGIMDGISNALKKLNR
jgi:hypothetical protein